VLFISSSDGDNKYVTSFSDAVCASKPHDTFVVRVDDRSTQNADGAREAFDCGRCHTGWAHAVAPDGRVVRTTVPLARGVRRSA
jgi:hypothetical protein